MQKLPGPGPFHKIFGVSVRPVWKRQVNLGKTLRQGMAASRGTESEWDSPGVVATSQKSESIKLPRLRFRKVLFESVI